jgi:hypothetical protein
MTSLKRNHHYVPQFWQRYFADAAGKLYARRDGGLAKLASPKSLMSGDWIYTVFDSNWLASDAVEDTLSQAEGMAATACRSLISSASVPDASTQGMLAKFVALQACRHPDILGRAHRRGKDLGAVIAEVHSMSESEFLNALLPFGVDATSASGMFEVLRARSQADLDAELKELEVLSPHDPQLPQTDSLLAQSQVESNLMTMDLIVLDAPPPIEFVLGDTPVPQFDLQFGFIVPITKAIALKFRPAQHPGVPSCTRRAASNAEVAACNRWQFDNALKVTIGSDPAALNAL